MALIRALPTLDNLRVSENEKVGVNIIIHKALEEPASGAVDREQCRLGRLGRGRSLWLR